MTAGFVLLPMLLAVAEVVAPHAGAPSTPVMPWAGPHGQAAPSGTGTVVVGRFLGRMTVGTTALESLGRTDILVARYDAAGSVAWAKRFGGKGMDAATSVIAMADGDLVVAGTFEDRIDFGGGRLRGPRNDREQVKVFLARFDPAGGHQWSHQIGVAPRQFSPRLTVGGADGSIVVSGPSSGRFRFGRQKRAGKGLLSARFSGRGKLLEIQLDSPTSEGAACPDLCAPGPSPLASGNNDLYTKCSSVMNCANDVINGAFAFGQRRHPTCATTWAEECVTAFKKGACGDKCACSHDLCETGPPITGCAATTPVATHDPYCRETWWDGICIGEVNEVVTNRCPCSHEVSGVGAALPAGCNACATTLWAIDPYCNNLWWDDNCVNEARARCSAAAP